MPRWAQVGELNAVKLRVGTSYTSPWEVCPIVSGQRTMPQKVESAPHGRPSDLYHTPSQATRMPLEVHKRACHHEPSPLLGPVFV